MISYDRLLKCDLEFEIPAALPVSSQDCIFLRIGSNENDLRTLTYQIAVHQNQGREVLLRSDFPMTNKKGAQQWAFCVNDVVTFYWCSGENVITCYQHALWTPALCKFWLLHTLLPLYFTIEETYYIFHAGAVEFDDKSILFTAESYGGKSTLTDFFIKQGHIFVSDDKVATFEHDGSIYAVPSYPFHRPYRDVEDLGYAVGNFAKSPKPIHSIFKLEPVEANADIEIRELQGLEKFKSLRYSSEINLSFLKNKRFAYLAQVACRIPVFTISVPRKIERLPEVYEFLRERMLIVQSHNLRRQDQLTSSAA